jgi:hypothetical protein
VQVNDRAATHAFRRKIGNSTCADIMSRDLVTAEYGTELGEAWRACAINKSRPFRWWTASTMSPAAWRWWIS